MSFLVYTTVLKCRNYIFSRTGICSPSLIDNWYFSGSHCDQVACDPRCETHGFCNNGSCICKPGWNGRHCTLGMYRIFYCKFISIFKDAIDLHCQIHIDVVAVSDTYRDDISDGYSIPDEMLTIGYSIPDEIPNTCFQLCELV